MIDWDKLVLGPIDATFGEPVRYETASSGAVNPALQGIFTDGYKHPAFNEDGSAGWNTSAPTLGVRAFDFTAAPVKNDRVTRKGKPYIVVDVRPDGVGWLILALKAMQ